MKISLLLEMVERQLGEIGIRKMRYELHMMEVMHGIITRLGILVQKVIVSPTNENC